MAYELKLNNVEFPRRGKGATGTKIVQVLGDWKINRDDEGKLMRPEMTEESIEAISKLHLSAFDSILPKLPRSLSYYVTLGINTDAERQDASLAGMLLARAIGDGFEESDAKAMQGIALNMVKASIKDADGAYEFAKGMFAHKLKA